MAYTTSDQNVKLTDGSGIFAKLKQKNFSRAFGQYSTDHQDAICASLGWASGAMSAHPVEAFTLKFKKQVGIEAENAKPDFNEVFADQIKSDYGNVYLNRDIYYDWFEDGQLSSGYFFDELIFADKAKYDIQRSIADLLNSRDKVNQQEAGVTEIINAIATVCRQMFDSNIIAAGTYQGPDVLNLKTGDTLPQGYLIQSVPVSKMSPADVAARRSTPIYVTFKYSGSTHFVTINVNIDR